MARSPRWKRLDRWVVGLGAAVVLALSAVVGGVTSGGAADDQRDGTAGASVAALGSAPEPGEAASRATAIWEFWVTTAAHLSGAVGTNWRTDLEVHNWGGTQASFTVSLLKRDQANTSPDNRTYSLGPGQAVRYSDLVSSMFSFSGAAAIKVSSTYDSLIVTSRTYNDQPAGTYGQFVRGRPLAEAVGPGEQGRVIHLTHNRSTTSGYRTNLLFVNATTASMQLNIDLYTASGAYLGRLQRTLAGYEYKQIDRAFESVTGSDVTDGYAVFSSPTAGAYFFAGASVIDNRTGDAVFVPHEKVTGSAPPPPTPSPTPTTPPTGSFGPITFATGVNSSTGEPINPGTSFAYGITRLYGIWPWSGVTPNTAFRFDWYRNGSAIGGGNSTLPYASGIAWQWTDGSPLPLGTYQLVIKVNNQVVLQGQCQIVSGSTPTPSPTPSPTPGTGSLAFRLTWNGTNDLDLYVKEPNGTTIYYNNRGPTSTGGRLDVDCNAGCDPARMCSTPIENIFWPTGGAPAGTYEFWVDWYKTCSGPTPTNFTLTVYVNGAVAQTYSGSLNGADSQHYTYTLGGGGGGGSVNMTMVTPSGWSGCVVCNYREVNPPVYQFLSIYYTTHVYWAVQNTGSSTITGAVKFGFYLDGTHFFTVSYSNSSGWPAGQGLVFHYALDTQSYISAGTHTFMVKADVDNAFAESNEGDNTCSTTKEWTTIVFSPENGSLPPGQSAGSLGVPPIQLARDEVDVMPVEHLELVVPEEAVLPRPPKR
ncbi:MAG: hypothetical protein HXY19_01215 [Thermoanaerobaculaceae bacterium]|nr:hypothetical protein [Thermoanaerobaculaceae bacterium]